MSDRCASRRTCYTSDGVGAIFLPIIHISSPVDEGLYTEILLMTIITGDVTVVQYGVCDMPNSVGLENMLISL